MEFYRCKNCYFPNTKPDLYFDDDKVCYACKFTDYYNDIDFEKRLSEFKELTSKVEKKSNKYDCIIPVSGGKDSTYQVHLIKNIAKLNPLLVTFEPSYPTKIGKKNLDNLVNTFNCDLVYFKKSPVYRKLARLGFDVVGDHEWPNHVGIYCWPMQMALNFDINLTFYGEVGGKIGLGRWDRMIEEKKVTREDVEQYIGMNGYRITDMIAMDKSITINDVIPYTYPSEDQLKIKNIEAYNLGYFFNWDFQELIKIIKDYGWISSNERTEGTFGNWEDLDCGFMTYHQYFKFIKYGYGRATDHASYELRHGRLSKKEAKELIIKYDNELPKKYFKEFKEFLNISEKYFFDTIDRFVNTELFKSLNGKLIRKWDGNLELQDHWYDSFD